MVQVASIYKYLLDSILRPILPTLNMLYKYLLKLNGTMAFRYHHGRKIKVRTKVTFNS